MTIQHKIEIDLASRGETPRLQANQGEAFSRQVEISLYADGAAWTIPEGTSAVIRYRTHDQDLLEGARGIYDTLPDGTAAWSTAENILTITLVPQMLEGAGQVQVDVMLIQGQALLGTGSFWIYVNRAPAEGTGSELQNYYRVASLEQLDTELMNIRSMLQELDAGKVSMTDPFISADLHMQGRRIVELGAPLEASDAASKGYVDVEVENVKRDVIDSLAVDASVTEIDGGHRVTITDPSGTVTFDVLNGLGSEIPPELIEELVEAYLAENPPVAVQEETDPTVPDWAKEPVKPTYTASEVGAVTAADLSREVEQALTASKESGEFDGADGKSAYEYALDGGYQGTEEEFGAKMAQITAEGPIFESEEHPGCCYRLVDGETEWLNPPMAAGVEYRTTERYLGSVVYAKLVNCGALPAAARKNVTYSTTPVTPIFAMAAISDGSVILGEGQAISLSATTVLMTTTPYSIVLTTVVDLSANTATMLVKYIKS